LNSGEWISGTFKEISPVTFSDNQFDYKYSTNPISTLADKQLEIPFGSRSSIWNFSGVNNERGQDFMVSFLSSGIQELNSPAKWRSFDAEITPVTYGFYSSNPDPQDPKSVCRNVLEAPQSTGKLFCVRRDEFIGSPMFKMDVRLEVMKSSVTSYPWIFSRTQNTKFSMATDGNALQVVLEGSPTSFVDAALSTERDDRAFENWMKVMKKIYGNYDYPGGKSAFLMNEQANFQAETPDAIPMFQAFSEFYDSYPFVQSYTDKPFPKEYQKNFWRFRPNFYAMESSKNKQCSANKMFAGSVSTNSSLFQPSPPTWNEENQSLDYQVAAPHLKGDGTVRNGTYELVLNESVAKCLWGLESITNNAKATVSVLNGDGSIQVSTSVFKVSNGLITFQVSGFSYSYHRIRVKLTKPESGALTNPSKQSVVPSDSSGLKPSVKTRTITCIKGKLTKKVTAVNPKCPAGYKKK
jgi:hypothetical protein